MTIISTRSPIRPIWNSEKEQHCFATGERAQALVDRWCGEGVANTVGNLLAQVGEAK